MNKKKIINDPVHGFISIETDLIYDLIMHPWFQRLRRIAQTGLLTLIYPGAVHIRFHHALGAMHLMQNALDSLQRKGTELTAEEKEGALIAILLHDLGHGPFSHALERELITGYHHEALSLLLMEKLNETYNGRLSTAIEIFKGKYPKLFLNQLISGQLDMDRMDYLKRDGFFTGVTEGNINSERIITMLAEKDNQLAVEEKGIYSVEHFLTARMFMYWQVYYHKAATTAESLLVRIFRRVRMLISQGESPAAFGNMEVLLYSKEPDFIHAHLDVFTSLDDSDVMAHIKIWAKSTDPILAALCSAVVNRTLPKTLVSDKVFPESLLSEKTKKINAKYGEGAADFLLKTHIRRLLPYDAVRAPIYLLNKNNELIETSAHPSTILSKSLLQSTEKHYISFPRDL